MSAPTRWLINLGLLVAWALATVVVDRLLDIGTYGYSLSSVIYLWIVMTTLTLPTGVLYLVLLELVPVSVSVRVRRIIAIVLSPFAGAWVFQVLFNISEPGRVVGALLVATLVYGSVVRLRPAAI